MPSIKPFGGLKRHITELLMGFCLGTANIIPGVSGGTFLLIFNIYGRVFAVLKHINKALLLDFISIGFSMVKHRGRNGTFQVFAGFLKENDFHFLFRLVIGAVVAILCLSGMMKFLLIHHFSLTYSLFFGLILVSILIPVRLLKSRNPVLFFFVLAGCALTVMVTSLVNPYDKAKLKSDHHQARYEASGPQKNFSPVRQTPDRIDFFAFTGKYTVSEYLYAGFCGAVSVSAMVLPGISGSLVMILMGAYFDVISAILALNQLHLDSFLYLGSFGLGIVMGGLVFARLINYFLERYYNATMAFLLGLMAGSLWALWPFKKVMVLAEQYVKQGSRFIVNENVAIHTNLNILPPLSMHLMWALFFFAVGCAVMFGFIKAESRSGQDGRHDFL